MNFHLRPYNQYILNIVTNIYLGLDFLVKIMYRQNYSWQGEITWIQKNKTKMFRSALEFLHILYPIMDEVDQ